MGSASVQPSVMRSFLEDPRSFCWPNDNRRNGIYYEFREGFRLDQLLKFQDRLGIPRFRPRQDTQQVKKYRVVEERQHEMNFDQFLAVKQLSREPARPADAIEEANAMKGLRHPHVTALLGIFYSECCDHLVLFPAGRCDLADFLACISQTACRQGSENEHANGRLVASRTPATIDYGDPLNLPLHEKLDYIQGYFLCLCQALAYLHKSKVRHKDIKLENIIIDDSRNVVLVDFGISKQDETDLDKWGITHQPNPPSTLRTSPPELAKGDVRDPRSDVWSLGCVFIEMISPLFGRTPKECQEHCRRYNAKSGTVNNAFWDNQERIRTWIDDLQLRDFRDARHERTAKTALSTLQQMLSEDKIERPHAASLWTSFDFAPNKCPDCHPYAERPWAPSVNQKQVYSDTQNEREKVTKKQNDKLENVIQQENAKKQMEAQRALAGVILPAPKMTTEVAGDSQAPRPQSTSLLSPSSRAGSPEYFRRRRDSNRQVHFSDEACAVTVTSPATVQEQLNGQGSSQMKTNATSSNPRLINSLHYEQTDIPGVPQSKAKPLPLNVPLLVVAHQQGEEEATPVPEDQLSQSANAMSSTILSTASPGAEEPPTSLIRVLSTETTKEHSRGVATLTSSTLPKYCLICRVQQREVETEHCKTQIAKGTVPFDCLIP